MVRHLAGGRLGSSRPDGRGTVHCGAVARIRGPGSGLQSRRGRVPGLVDFLSGRGPGGFRRGRDHFRGDRNRHDAHHYGRGASSVRGHAKSHRRRFFASHRSDRQGPARRAEPLLQSHDGEHRAAAGGGQGKGAAAIGDRDRARSAEPAFPARGSADAHAAGHARSASRRAWFRAITTITRW